MIFLANMTDMALFIPKDNLLGDEGLGALAQAACEGGFPSLRLMYLYGAPTAMKAGEIPKGLGKPRMFMVVAHIIKKQRKVDIHYEDMRLTFFGLCMLWPPWFITRKFPTRRQAITKSRTIYILYYCILTSWIIPVWLIVVNWEPLAVNMFLCFF